MRGVLGVHRMRQDSIGRHFSTRRQLLSGIALSVGATRMSAKSETSGHDHLQAARQRQLVSDAVAGKPAPDHVLARIVAHATKPNKGRVGFVGPLGF